MDFCIEHGFEFMKSRFGDPIAYCAKCEEEAMDWRTIESAPEGKLVMTKIDDADGVRNEQLMKREGNLWWINSGTPRAMYVYYTPTHWRELREGDRR